MFNSLEKIIFAVIVGLIIFMLSLGLVSVSYKARHYSAVTGVEVTYWDAFFLDFDPSKHVIVIDKEVIE